MLPPHGSRISDRGFTFDEELHNILVWCPGCPEKIHRNEERYKMSSGNACNMGKNQLIPFVVILAVALGAVVFGVRATLSSAVSSTVEQKTSALTKTLAMVLVDPFSMGEYDHMQAILDATKKADPDVEYAIVLTPDGKAVATTDRSLKDVAVTRDEFEKEALKANDFMLRPTKDGYETVMPIKTVIGPAGFVRIGMNRSSAEQAIGQTMGTALLLAAVSFVVAALAFGMICKGTAAGAST
jgi:uncharacterized membrane protein affecting hemolysin expression